MSLSPSRSLDPCRHALGSENALELALRHSRVKQKQANTFVAFEAWRARLTLAKPWLSLNFL